MQVHLAADAAGQERGLPAIFAVAHDGMADRGHVHAQLVGAAGQRLELDPGGLVARAVDDAIFRAGGLALGIGHHLLAPGAGLFRQRKVDGAGRNVGHARHQRPVDLLGAAAGKAL